MAAQKADFTHIYTQPDPRAYYRTLGALDYEIPQHGRGVFDVVLDELRASNEAPVVLDVCCSYGINAALLNLTKSLADLGVGDGVRVNAVNPSSIATERTQVRIERLAKERGIATDEAAAALARELRVARFGTPEEIASVVAFLCSPGAGYMQGAILDVDGGQTRTL